MTHLVHVAGPFHDVLEGSLTGDVVDQKDSLNSDRQRWNIKDNYPTTTSINMDVSSIPLNRIDKA